MRRILSHGGHQCSKESRCYRAFKAHTVTSSLVSPWVSSLCDLLLSLAPLRHLYAHICLPGQCRWLQGCESLLSPDCNILSLHLAVVCLDLSFQCQILLHHLSHRQQRGSLGGAAQALTVSRTDLHVCTAAGFYAANCLQSFGINWHFCLNKRSQTKPELDV